MLTYGANWIICMLTDVDANQCDGSIMNNPVLLI